MMSVLCTIRTARIIFTSSRVESYSLCQNYLACALYIMRGDGGDLRRFDFTTLSTLSPVDFAGWFDSVHPLGIPGIRTFSAGRDYGR